MKAWGSRAQQSTAAHLGSEDGEGHEGAEEAERDPVGGEFAQAEVEDQELQLGGQREAGAPDVPCAAAPQLHWTARPAVLLLPEREEARRQLRSKVP